MASIGKSQAIAHGQALLDYANRKGIGLEGQNIVGETPQEVIREMREQQQLHHGGTISKPYFSMVFAPDPNDYRSEDMNQLAHEYMKRFSSRLKTHTGEQVDFSSLQFKPYLHEEMSERKVPHIHILCNRILPNGEVISDSWVGKIAKATAEEMDKSRKLKTAEEVGKDLRAVVKQRAHEALTDYAKTAKGEQFDQQKYREFCKKHGLEMSLSVASTGRISGYYLQLDEARGGYHTKYKASDIDKQLTLSRIDKTFQAEQLRLMRLAAEAEKKRRAEEEKRRREEEQIKRNKNEQDRNRGRGWHL